MSYLELRFDCDCCDPYRLGGRAPGGSGGNGGPLFAMAARPGTTCDAPLLLGGGGGGRSSDGCGE